MKDAVDFIVDVENDYSKLCNILTEPWFINDKATEYFNEIRFCDFFQEFVFSKKPVHKKFLLAKRQTFARLNVARKKIYSRVFDKSYCHVS